MPVVLVDVRYSTPQTSHLLRGGALREVHAPCFCAALTCGQTGGLKSVGAIRHRSSIRSSFYGLGCLMYDAESTVN